MTFPTIIPSQLTYKTGDLFLSAEDKEKISTRSFPRDFIVSEKGKTATTSERIIFFGSGYGELLLTRYLVKTLKNENITFDWWFTFLDRKFHHSVRKQIDPINSLTLYEDSIIDILSNTKPTLLCIFEHSYPLKMASLMRLCSGWIKCPVFLLSAKIRTQWIEQVGLYGERKQQLYRKSFQSVSYAVTDDFDSANILFSLKVDKSRILLGHSLKWHTGETQINQKIREKIRSFWNLDRENKKILILASIHGGEIQNILQILGQLNSVKNIKIILAPHSSLPILFAAGNILQSGLTYTKWSEMDKCHDPDSDIILVDSYGDLASIYSCGDAAYIGGGFDPRFHGHNAVEAIALNVPAIIGPDYGNFQGIVEALREKLGIEVATDLDDLGIKIERMLTDESYRQEIVKNAAEVYQHYSRKEPLELRLVRAFILQRDST